MWSADYRDVRDRFEGRSLSKAAASPGGWQAESSCFSHVFSTHALADRAVEKIARCANSQFMTDSCSDTTRNRGSGSRQTSDNTGSRAAEISRFPLPCPMPAPPLFQTGSHHWKSVVRFPYRIREDCFEGVSFVRQTRETIITGVIRLGKLNRVCGPHSGPYK